LPKLRCSGIRTIRALHFHCGKAAADTLSVKLQILQVRDVDAFDSTFRAAIKEGSEAAVLLPAPLMSRNAARIADLATSQRLPTLFFSEEAVKAGGLISYGASLVDIYRRAAYFVDRILGLSH
jgi:putative ABC transport system substrate-binding protein